MLKYLSLLPGLKLQRVVYISAGLIIKGSGNPLDSASFGIGLGIAFYGILYLIIHDLFVRKRFLPSRSDSRIMRLVRRAHQRHHQSAGKVGQEPYGLFLFPYDKYDERERKS